MLHLVFALCLSCIATICHGTSKLLMFFMEVNLNNNILGCNGQMDTIRLVGGENQGLVEICESNQWESVCDVLWTDMKAEIACRELNLPYTGARGTTQRVRRCQIL